MGIDKAGRNIMGWTAGHLQGTTNPSQSCRYFDKAAPEGLAGAVSGVFRSCSPGDGGPSVEDKLS
jgi:hypothetical protein